MPLRLSVLAIPLQVDTHAMYHMIQWCLESKCASTSGDGAQPTLHLTTTTVLTANLQMKRMHQIVNRVPPAEFPRPRDVGQ